MDTVTDAVWLCVWLGVWLRDAESDGDIVRLADWLCDRDELWDSLAVSVCEIDGVTVWLAVCVVVWVGVWLRDCD